MENTNNEAINIIKGTDIIRKEVDEYLENLGIKFECTGGASRTYTNEDGHIWEYYNYVVTFYRPDLSKELSLNWSQGIGCTEDPTATDVLCNILMDLDSDERTNDSIKDSKLFERCKEQAKKVKEFFDESEIENLKDLVANY